MNLEKLFQMQKVLDSNIEWLHPEIKEEGVLVRKVLSAQVELGELANEWRGFKFWSRNTRPKDGMLEEFVDVLHFCLSIGIELGHEIENISLFDKEPPKDINEHFVGLNIAFGNLSLKKHVNRWHYKEILTSLLQLGIELGFTPIEIENAYYEKNNINLKRQEDGY